MPAPMALADAMPMPAAEAWSQALATMALFESGCRHVKSVTQDDEAPSGAANLMESGS